MVYKVVVSVRTQREIEHAIDYYALHSVDAPLNFIIELAEAYEILAKNPFFRIRYKNIRVLNLKRFPYSLYYTIADDKKIIKIISCFHNSRDPKRRPKNL